MNRSVNESFTLTNAEEFCRVFIGSFDVSIANQRTVLGTSRNKEMVNQAAEHFSRYKELSGDKVTDNVKKIAEREEIRSDTLSVPDMTKCLLHLGYHLLSRLLGNGHPKTIVPSKVLVINFCFNNREGDVLRTFNRHLSLQSRRIFEVTKSGECVVLRLFKLDPYIVQLRVFVFSDSPNDLMKVVHDVISEVLDNETRQNLASKTIYAEEVDVTKRYLECLNSTKNENSKNDQSLVKVLGSIFLVDELLPHDYYHVNADEPPHKLQIVKPFFIVSSATPDDTYDIYKILSWSIEPYKDIKSNSNVTYDKNKPITSDQQTRSRRAERSGVSFNSISKHPSFNALAVLTDLNSKLFDKEFDIGIYSLDLILYEKFINQFIQLSDDICRYLESNQLKIAFEQYELDRIYNRICAGGDDKIDDFYKQVKKIIDLMTLTKKIKFDKFLGRHGIKVVPWRSEWTYRLIKRFILQVNDEKSDHQLIFRELCKIFAGIIDEKLRSINYIDYLKLERADSSKHSKSLESIRGYLQPEQDKTLWVTEILIRIQFDNSNGKYGSNFANSINAYDTSEVQFSTRITKFINAVSSRRVLYDQVTEESKGNPLGKFHVTNFVRVNVKSNDFECVKLYLFVEFKEGFTYSKDHDVFITINDLIHSAFDKNFRGCNVTIEQSLKLNCLQSTVSYNHWAKVELKKSRSKQGNFINEFVNEIEMFQYLYYKNDAKPLVKSYTRGQIDNARNKQSKVK